MKAELRTVKTDAELALAESYASAEAELPGDGKVVALREAAFKRFEAQGLPHRRIEQWKYTDLRALMRDAKPLAGPPDAAAKERAKSVGGLIGDMDARRLVFVDGAFVPELSDLAKLETGSRSAHARAGACRGRSAGRRASRQGRADGRRKRGGAQHRADERWRGDPRRGGRDRRAADPSGVRRDRRQARLDLHALAWW